MTGNPDAAMDLPAAIRLASSELRLGPLPGDAALRPGPDSRTVLFACPPFSAQVELDADKDQVLAKRLFARDGQEVLELRYDRYQAYDALHRPTRERMRLGDHTQATVQLWHFKALERVGEEHRSLQLPAEVRMVTLQQLLDQLQHEGG